MKVESVNVGEPRPVVVGERTVLTSIFKHPVEGRVAIKRHNLEGDRQSDLTVHGGPFKAVYCYPQEHYDFWRTQLPDAELPPGMFGENLTTSGLLETEAAIGGEYRVGSAVLQVTQPRMPCFKLQIRFNRADIVKRFWQSGRSGIYFSVIEEGQVAAGDPIEKISALANGITVSQVVALYRGDETSRDLLDRALSSPLHGSWKQGLRERISEFA